MRQELNLLSRFWRPMGFRNTSHLHIMKPALEHPERDVETRAPRSVDDQMKASGPCVVYPHSKAIIVDGPTYSPESRTAVRTALIRTLAMVPGPTCVRIVNSLAMS